MDLFLQTCLTAIRIEFALASSDWFPIAKNRVRKVASTDWVCQLRWANKEWVEFEERSPPIEVFFAEMKRPGERLIFRGVREVEHPYRYVRGGSTISHGERQSGVLLRSFRS